MALVTGSCYGQPMYVEAPLAQPLRFGLFSVSDLITPGDPHWQQGVEWEQEPGCNPASVYACPTCNQNDGNTAPAKTYTSGIVKVNALPFTVYHSFKCSPIGTWADGFDRARRGLLLSEERAVENEISLGTHMVSNALTRATTVDATPVPGTPVTVAQGVALLEQYGAAHSHGEFVILMSRRDATMAGAQQVLSDNEPDGTVLTTKLATPVAAMGGFDGKTGPNNVAAGTGNAWIFATGKPQIRRSEVFETPGDREHALSQRTNDFAVLAERTYSVGWDCLTAGVLVTSV